MAGRERRSRSVTFVYGGISGAILMAVAVVALVVVPPSPPSVAEFAPSASETIDEAPDAQSSQFGEGGGGDCATGQECVVDPETGALLPVTGKVPKVADIIKSRVRRCVGDPPRQTEDPQSPACVNYFEGDNGGSTYKGVSRDEIRVGATQQFVANYEATYRLILEHFNRRYELYGRKLRLLTVDIPSCCTPPAEQASAARMDELDVFASSSPSPGGGHRTFVAEMARQKRISLDAAQTLESSEEIERYKPYFYSFRPGIDVALRNAAELYCRSLHGSPAEYAGAELRSQPRKIAVIDYDRVQGAVDGKPVLDGLAKCGASPGKVVIWPRVTDTSDTRGRTAALDLRNQGFTTVVCTCTVGEFRGVKGNFGDVGFQPELYMAGIPRHDSDFLFQTDNDRFRMFGITSANKTLPLSDEPWVQAVKEVAPDYQATNANAEIYRDFYDQMRILASGIQSAGPNLDPDNFEKGLIRTRFPNPGSAAPPNWQSGGSFGPSDHTFVEDFAVISWSDTGESYGGTKPRGTFCYVDRGARWALGQWPKRRQPFFDLAAPCR